MKEGNKRIKIKDKEIVVFPNVFEPYYVLNDDTLYNLPELENCESVLDMGTGTGILPIIWVERYPNLKEIWGVDILEDAVENAKENVNCLVSCNARNKVKILKSDLFNSIPKDKKFDVIVFNGPHIDKENEDDKNKLGSKYIALYDPDFRTAQKFFAEAEKYLNKGGTIIYTFSDYGDLYKLMEIIKEYKWLATFISVSRFEDRDPSQEPLRKPTLWYNLKIQRIEDANIEKYIRNFIKPIEVLSQLYLPIIKDESKFNEFIQRILLFINMLTSQLDNLLDNDEWFFLGYSYPTWEVKELHWEFFYSFSPTILDKEREMFKKAVKKFTDILANKLNGEIELIVDYLKKEGKGKEEEIEAFLGEKFWINEFKFPPRLVVEFDEKKIENSFNFNSLVRKDKTDDVEEEFKQRLKNFNAACNDKTKQKIIKNLYLNLYAIRYKYKRLRYINFKRVKIPTGGTHSAIYVFSSIPKNNKLMAIVSAIYEILTNSIEKIQTPIWQYIREMYALRSAVAAIMARNMSHQQGSAVIPYLISETMDKAFLKQYLSYIETRMDFIASAATMEFPKSGLDLWFIRDLIFGFITQYGLLGSIGKSEGYNWENINFEVYIGEDKCNILSCDNLNKLQQTDKKVWVPGGYVGMHAFYLIIENILRNSAKYAPKKDELKIKIKLEEENNQKYSVKVWDNISSDVEKIKDFNKRIRDSLIKETGEIREGDWGFGEMRICATYLMSESERKAAEKLDEEEESPIECIKSEDDTIGYKFYLKKPAWLEVYDEPEKS